MGDEVHIKNGIMRLVMGDITELDVGAFVYYARHDLELGSGFGGAISVRGGPTIQEELRRHEALKTTEAIITAAGNLTADHIIHAVGPRFQEPDVESKLRETVLNVMKLADETGIRRIAFPPMGTGFYGIPLDTSAEITLGTVAEYLAGETGIEEVAICVQDNREYQPFHRRLETLKIAYKEAS